MYTAFTHYLNLYQKPKIGTAFIRRHETYNYRHRITAIGGFDTMSCDIAIRSREEGQEFLDQYLGNRVAVYADNPAEPIWEGFINRMTFSAGGVQYSISLDEMANRMTSQHTTSSATPVPAAPTTVNNTDSQAVYGIKQDIVDLGHRGDGTGAAGYVATQLAQRAWPKSSITRDSGGGMLHLECLGIYHTLNWEIYRNTATTNVQYGVLFNAVRASLGNGTTFFDNTDTTEITTNTPTINQEKTRGQSAWDVMREICEQGDASNNYWICGITPTDFRTGTRRLYYRSFSPTIKFTARQRDGLRIRNTYGQLVPPWTVRPDAGIRVSDMLIGWDGLGDNPTETYIFSIEYDANQQTVDYHGDDDLTAEGAFQLKRYGKPTNKRMGAPRRAV